MSTPECPREVRQPPPTCPSHAPRSSGSLLRTPELAAARRRAEAGELPRPNFKAIETPAVTTRSGSSEDAGIDVVTDGELRRWAFFGHLIDATGRLRPPRRVGHPVPRPRPGRS